MNVQPPRRNLPPDAEIWGRWVEDTLSGINTDTVQSDQGITNTLKAINGTLVQMSSQINALATQQTTLTTTVTDLGTAQNDIASQLVSINALIGAQVTFGSVGASATGFTPSGTPTDYATSAITVPTGYSQAIVICTVDASGMASASSQLYVSGVIAGTAGGQASDAGAITNSAAASAIRSFTGLSGGTIGVAVRISGAGTGWNTSTTVANCNAIAVFLK